MDPTAIDEIAWPARPLTVLLDSDSTLRHAAAPDVLVIDEVGYLSCSNRHADLLFELVSRHYQHESMVLTTNKAFRDWG